MPLLEQTKKAIWVVLPKRSGLADDKWPEVATRALALTDLVSLDWRVCR